MSNWVKFSDRHPTVANADSYGSVVILRDGNEFVLADLKMTHRGILKKCGDYDDCHWLENVPPFPRTLEDVAEDLATALECLRHDDIPTDLIKEVREILGKYQGRKVKLGEPFLTPDGPKKRSVYVKNDKGNVVKVNFGDVK